nr:uncharacterized protein LOC111415174 isoform X2 [Onthophagus taurus]
MDPVFQRLGDVTIQRLDKTKDSKVGLQSGGDLVDDESKDEIHSDINLEDSQGIKRNFDNLAGPSNKRTKFEFKKTGDESSNLSYSDPELSDYDSESEIESDEDIGIKSHIREPAEISSELETSTDFLDKLVDEPYPNEESEEIKNPSEIKCEVDDYEYDIKEKLKEMGEISFETVKKGDKPKKSEETSVNEVSVTPAKKSEDDLNDRNKLAGNLRRNIREVMDETKLDESTLAAQRQEMERLRRVQEQQRILRDYQRQIQQERVISLLQGNVPKAGTSGARIGSTVLVKLPNGQTMTKVIKKPFELVKVPKSAVPPHKSPKNLIAIKKPSGNLTPSVSIAPVMKRPPQLEQRFSDSDSDSEDAMSTRVSLQKPKPKDPVTTIDISSDDDCIVVSESENDPNDDTDEDPSNSGLHTNDEFNQPDEQGRVVVNVGHAEDEQDVYVAPQIARIIKPHQIGGVRFLFDNVIESVNRFESSTGFGCILAHSMGLGKTLQIVCFSDIFLRHTQSRTILCIMPINTLQNWMAEYNMWLPTEEAVPNSPLNAHGEVRPRNFNLHVLNDSHKTLAARAKVIHEWKAGGGVLLIGYEQYRLLSLRKHPKSRKKVPVIEPVDDDKSKLLFDEVHEALVKPGPDLVICDEGHRIKNSHASISQALKQMRTKRRVVLTGYPLQNNLMEYWCMVDFVRPNYLGTKTEFCNMFERPIQNGQCIDSTEADIKLMRYRAHVLHSLLLGFVQRRSHTVLQTALPQKEEYVLLVRMTPFQRTLYETFMNEVVRTQTVPNPLKAFAVCCKIWNHPDVLYYFLKKQAGGETVDIDLEEVASTTTNETTAKPKKGSKKSTGKGKNAKPAASVTPYNSSDIGGKNKKSSGKNQNNNNNINNNISQTQPTPQTPTEQNNYQNYPVKMEFEYSNSSGYGSNQSFSSGYQSQSQNMGESPSYPYSNQSTPSSQYPASGTPQSDSNIYPYQPNTGNQNYSTEPFAGGPNHNFDQKPNFNKGNDYPPNFNQQPTTPQYNQNSQNYNQPPKNSFPEHQENYPANQQGNFTPTQSSYPPNEQEGFRNPENEFNHQQNTGGFQNQHATFYDNQNPQEYPTLYEPCRYPVGRKPSQPGPPNNESQQPLQPHSGYATSNNNNLPPQNHNLPPQNHNLPPQNHNLPPQNHNLPPQNHNLPPQNHNLPPPNHNLPSQNLNVPSNGHNINPQGHNVPSQTHNIPPQSHGTPPHGHHQHNSSYEGLNPHSQNMNHPHGGHSQGGNHSQSTGHPQGGNHSQNIAHPQSGTHPQNAVHSQAGVHPHTLQSGHPQNSGHSQPNSHPPPPLPHPQPHNPSTPYPQHHSDNPDHHQTGTNPGYPPQHNQHNQPTTPYHPSSVDGYPQGVGQNPAPGVHPLNVGHQQAIQNVQNVPNSQHFGNYPPPQSNQPQSHQHHGHQTPQNAREPPQNIRDQTQNVGGHPQNQPQSVPEVTTNPGYGMPPNNGHQIQAPSGHNNVSGYPQNANYQVQSSAPPQNVNHPTQIVPPQNLNQPPPNIPPNSNAPQTIQNYPPQPAQTYPPNVPPHYNSTRPNQENPTYPLPQDQQSPYPNREAPQNQPYQQNNTPGYQHPPPNTYQSGSGQGEYTTNQYNENQYHGNSTQNYTSESPPKGFQPNSTNSYQNPQQNPEYSSQPYQNQQPPYQNYQQNQYPNYPNGGNNNSGGKDNTFPQNYKQEVPQSPYKQEVGQPPSNYPNQNQQFQPPGNFDNYQNQQQPYWNQEYKPNENYNKPNESYNFKPPFNQNYPNQQWKKEEKSPSSNICPSPVKSEPGDIKPKINIISDIKLSGNSAYDMNKKINILSDIKLEPKTENDEIKEEVKSEKGIDIKQEPSDDDIKIVEATPAIKTATKEDTGIPYDWAIELLKDYVPGIIENSAKLEILFCIIKESIALGDRLLVFSQSLITLDLIEQFLQMNVVPGDTLNWAKNVNYYRLDGSTSALEREKLINEFNSNPKIYLFLVSTRAGSLGINLIGANRVVVLDASWNPCHDTQAVCRVYRYGQRKPCFVYRLVVDNCLEKKIYDRQINKQGMSDRVVDECNPDAHLTIKDVSTLCWDDKTEEGEEKDWSHCKDNYIDVVLQKVLVQHGKRLNKEPFQHESLLVDRKDKQLSQQEKRLAKKGYEREKQAARQPSYNVGGVSRGHRPVASVRPMQQGGERPTRWIPAEHWQRQGMTAQEMTLPLDVVIPTNQPDKGNIVLKAGQKVLVLKSPKGVYMQLESGKIVAIKTAIKVRGKVDEDQAKAKAMIKNNTAISVLPQKRIVKPFAPNLTKLSVKSIKQNVPNLVSKMQTVTKRVQTAKTKPYNIGQEITRTSTQAKSETESHPSSSDEERTLHGNEKRHFNFSKDNILNLDNKKSAHNSRNSSLERREMSTDEDTISPIVTTAIKPKNVRGKSKREASTALERLDQCASTIMAKNKQTFQESLDTITSTYTEDDKHPEPSHSATNQSTQSISSSSEPEVIPVDDVTYPENEPTSTSTGETTSKSDIPTPDYGYNYYGYAHGGHVPYPPPPQGYPGYPPQPYEMMGYQQPQYNYAMYPPQGYPPPPQGYPQGPYEYQPPPPHPQGPPPPVYAGYPPYPPQQYPPPPPQGMYVGAPPPGGPPPPPPGPGYEYGYVAPHAGSAPPPAAPYYTGH